MRGFFVVIAGPLLAFACVSYNDAPDAPTTDGGAEAASPALDSGTIQVAIPDGAPEASRGPIGVGCADRVPPANECFDYENGLIHQSELSVSKSTLAIGDMGSNSPHGLHAIASADTHAFDQVDVPTGFSHVMWTIDFHLDSGMGHDTELTDFLVPGKSANQFCQLLVQRSTDAMSMAVVEYCSVDAAADTLASIPIPPGADNQWMNVAVDIDFASKTAAFTASFAEGTVITKQGIIRRLTLGPASHVSAGIAYAVVASTVDSDNFAVFWH